MRSLRLTTWSGALALLAVALIDPVTPGNAASAATPEDICWSIKTTICSDCAESDSKYCDPRAAEGAFVTCIQTVKEPCPGFTCSTVNAQTGPPCSTF